MSLQPPNGWKRPTLRDHLEMTAPHAVKAEVRCVCRRKELPSAMIDVRGLDGDLRLSCCRELPAPVPDFLCAPCVERLHMKEQIDRVEIARQIGAPVEWCGWYAAKVSRRPQPHGMPKALHPSVAPHAAAQAEKFAVADAIMVALGQIDSMPVEVLTLPTMEG
jgi:hypothetical protein